jgi:hypothetical protein
MQHRRRSTAHIFKENSEAEKAKLETKIGTLKSCPERDALGSVEIHLEWMTAVAR